MKEGKRWSGFEWADQKKEITLVGAGGIGSWTALSLSRIDHDLVIYDGDRVDNTNVHGGQLFKKSHVGNFKVVSVENICREFGCENVIHSISNMYKQGSGLTNVCITGLDNMSARKLVFEDWFKQCSEQPSSDSILIDGRMAGELHEVFAVQFSKPEQVEEYKKKWLFEDSEVEELDCTMKQTTFMAMGIASIITSTLCNHLYNLKLGIEIREVPFHQRFFSPILDHRKQENGSNESEESKKEEGNT